MKPLNKTTYSQIASVPCDFIEKRNSPRYPFSPAVEVTDLLINTRTRGRLSDISRNGCYVDTINPFAEHVAVTLTITRDHQSFKTQAKVVYSKTGMGMGLLFTTAEPEQLHVLGLWLSELSGEKVSEQQTPNAVVQPKAANGADHELRKIVSELVILLNRKNFLGDSEGMALLRKLSK